MQLGALEAGGTKMVCSIGNEAMEVLDRIQIPTTTPEETIPRIVAYFKERPVAALGIGSFGPVDLHKGSPTYGYITSTPKPGWGQFPLLATLSGALGVPTGFDTDVNVAALAEWKLGAAKGLDSCLYVTVGTGVGGGLVIGGKLVHGLVHPEIGHMLLRPMQDDPTPDGFCPYHIGCVEGLARGPAIEKRWGAPAHMLPEDHPAWALEAEYLAQMCVNAIVSFSPEKIVLGGGVMEQAHLFPLIRRRVQTMLNGYVVHPMVMERIDEYIVPPVLRPNSGVIGALLLALEQVG